ncbi:Retrovirus-related Pol polyprotein from transposon 17.6 [Cucumis melo var. makuwa]|uniref:Retrovirus-related Pol polyprotein from transposon 17.6 n=1 Tax=Cucumis melo var. makuwa TaxID=1194695 RepID=A0A5D3BLR6_CUCMM|nr:Retrovirus-related Pol polyprotein from transposon 17.6 [Cucumis melo var. makuwa]
MCFNVEEVKFNVVNAMKISADNEKNRMIESLGWDYCEEEAYHELYNTEEFFEDEDPSYILEEVNVVSGKKKFEFLDLQPKGFEDMVSTGKVGKHFELNDPSCARDVSKVHDDYLLKVLGEIILEKCEETQLILNWEMFHFMVGEGIVLRHKISNVGLEVNPTKTDLDKVVHPIYYASKTLNKAQENYTTIEKELLSVVFAIQKFGSYIVFDLEIIDRKGIDNQVADHLSHLNNETFQREKKEIKDEFPDEQLLRVEAKESWHADIVNYLISWALSLQIEAIPDIEAMKNGSSSLSPIKRSKPSKRCEASSKEPIPEGFGKKISIKPRTQESSFHSRSIRPNSEKAQRPKRSVTDATLKADEWMKQEESIYHGLSNLEPGMGTMRLDGD